MTDEATTENIPEGPRQTTSQSPPTAKDEADAKSQEQRSLSFWPIAAHVEVTLRISVSLVLAFILSFGHFPSAVPPSQAVLIGSITAAFTMVLPTLMFSIGAVIFPGLVMGTCVGLLVATLLLAIAAVAGRHAYVAAYFVVACIVSGLRFHKQSSVGNNTNVVLMLTALNTMGLAAVAEEHGLHYVASLWTESGIDNPHAVMRNTLIGMCWIALCCAVARLIPPWRTARHVLSTQVLPKVLMDLAEFVRMTVQHHNDTEDDQEQHNNQIQEEITKIVHDASITVGGEVAGMTALEPRIFHCKALQGPVDLVGCLRMLTLAVDGTIFSALSLRAFSHARFEELEVGGLKAAYLQAANRLEQCSKALATMDDAILNDDTSTSDVEAQAQGSKTTAKDITFDPVFLASSSEKVETQTKLWISSMSPNSNKSAKLWDEARRKVIAKSIMPWLMGSGLAITLGLLSNTCAVFMPSTWQSIVKPPYTSFPKAFWCLKFAIGFTALVCMNVYWPAFAQLEVSVNDAGNPVQSSHFAGWYLIAYAFGTTPTVEGTWKKSTLRLLGTALGGLSGWLALTFCGNSPYGLSAWLTIGGACSAYLCLPPGTKARMGLEKDYAWGPGYFNMTQVLVVLEVYLGLGGKNDITVNRIVANGVGIVMAMVMATIPPGIYGGSPLPAKSLLQDKKEVFCSCIRMLLGKSLPHKESVGEPTDDKESIVQQKEALGSLHESAKARFLEKYTELSDNFTDASQLQKMCILKLDPRLRTELDHLAVLGSSILSLLCSAQFLVENESQFLEGSPNQQELTKMLEGLENSQHGDMKSGTLGDKLLHHAKEMADSEPTASPAVSHENTFVHHCVFIYHYILHREANLQPIQWGFFAQSKQKKQ